MPLIGGVTAGLKNLDYLMDGDKNLKLNTNSPEYELINMGQNLQQGVSDDIDNGALRFVYNAGVSGAQSIGVAATDEIIKRAA